MTDPCDDLGAGGEPEPFYRQFDAAEILAYFAELDEELQTLGSPPVHLVIVGGASVALRRSSRVTGDVDVVSEGMNDLVRRAARAVAERHNLAPDWLNDGVKGLAVALPVDAQQAFAGGCLVVESVGPEYLLAMKLTAARPEDLPDCVYLINELGVRDIDTLLDLIEQALPPPRTPTAKMQYFTQEALEAARSAASGPQPAGAAGDAQAPARPEPDTREQPHRWRSFLARDEAIAAGRSDESKGQRAETACQP